MPWIAFIALNIFHQSTLDQDTGRSPLTTWTVKRLLLWPQTAFTSLKSCRLVYATGQPPLSAWWAPSCTPQAKTGMLYWNDTKEGEHRESVVKKLRCLMGVKRYGELLSMATWGVTCWTNNNSLGDYGGFFFSFFFGYGRLTPPLYTVSNKLNFRQAEQNLYFIYLIFYNTLILLTLLPVVSVQCTSW